MAYPTLPAALASRDIKYRFNTALAEIEDALIQKRTVDGQTVIPFPSRLNHDFIYLRGATDRSEVGLIQGAEERFGDLMA